MAKKKSKKKVVRRTPAVKDQPGQRGATSVKKKKVAGRRTAAAARSGSEKKAVRSTAKTKATARRKTKTKTTIKTKTKTTIETKAKTTIKTTTKAKATTGRVGTSSRHPLASQKGSSRAASRPASAKAYTGKLARKTKKPSIKAANKASLHPATAQDPIQFPEESRPIPKTKLTRKELNEFRKLLLAKRAELTGDVENMSSQMNSRNGVGGDHGTMPIHMADIGSDNWEHEFTLGLLANEHERIREIDNALLRIEKRTYGICLATHHPISKARLTAKPWAKYCIAYARAREQGRAS